MAEVTDFAVGQRVLVNVDLRPRMGHVVKIGRKYVWVMMFGGRRACLPSELKEWGEPWPTRCDR
jgi:hypothetical protein